MNKLLSYYQKELCFLKQHGKVFASRFPKIARRLGIVEGESEDPHVSRLIESFALLTSRIHQRLDEEMPYVIDALISTLAPQFSRPLPSVCIVMLTPDPLKSGITGKNELPEKTMLYTRQSVPVSCVFQTVYPVTLLPLSVHDVLLSFNSDELDWQLQLDFKIWPGATLSRDRIRLYLNGPGNAVNILYALLCSEIKSLTLRHNGLRIQLSTDAVQPVGFNTNEALLSQDTRIDPVHIQLLDYFWFPQKFSFIDIQLPSDFSATGNETFELLAVFKRNALTPMLEKLTSLIDRHFFRLNCTPAINLFDQRAEPVTLTDSIAEYPVISDSRNQTHSGVWTIEQVTVQHKVGNRIDSLPVLPLLENYSCINPENHSGLSWQLIYHPHTGNQEYVQKPFIAFSERPDRLRPDGPEIIIISMICSNLDLPHQMQYGRAGGDFTFDAPFSGMIITALTHPTHQIMPPEKSEVHLRFLSQLTLNHQLLDGEQGTLRLKEVLALYNVTGDPEKLRLLTFIQDLSYLPVTARLISNDPHSLARGLHLVLTFSHEALQEPGFYLFCSLLDRLLALYAPVNSFTRLTTCIEREPQTRRIWPVRAGKLSWY